MAGIMKDRELWRSDFRRLALPAVIGFALLSMSGCLATTAGPSFPYIRPAQSVPANDPMAIRIASRVEDMEAEIQRLRGSIEQLGPRPGNEAEIRNLQDRVAAIEHRLGMDQNRSPAPTQPPIQPGDSGRPLPSVGTQPPEPPAASAVMNNVGAPVEIRSDPVAADESIFKEAYALFGNKAYDDAANKFDELLKKYPKSKLAPDAIYWIGESRLAQGRFDEAVLQFDRVIKDFPGSGKELSALLKQGQAFAKMGDTKSAKIIYKRLISQNPHSDQARHAAASLKSLNSHK
jgi:tol-pal system protein YbgF